MLGQEAVTGQYLVGDCAAKSPKGHRSIGYDRAALQSRKEHKPAFEAGFSTLIANVTLGS
ncbi:DUF4256 domain-containing protein [Paenibacillus campi]|uniref:DUF4256 domain-containing protein n=1 Tax=Paenibacillus campi TaxID=3106031 RepID=UPI002AFFB33E|nr:DUF4256 domain-containing protein [Paenibacillus sp. SGZ-1014]